MHNIVYGFFYLLSLLPFRVLYILSDGIYGLIYYLFKYRRDMVMQSLNHTFPEKSEAEKIKIAKAFYKNFCDTWVEMIKNFSISPQQVKNRIKCDFSLAGKWFNEGKSLQVVGAHFMNWEYLPACVPMFQPYTTLAIFMPLSSATMDKVVYKLRSRFGLVLLRAGNMQEEMAAWRQKQYLILIGADQSPSNPESAVWLNFCNRPTGFITGPWLRAVKQPQPHVFFKMRKPKRGHYEFTMVPFIDDPSETTVEEIARTYARMIEEEIRIVPELFLWTHNRWKKPWKPEYQDKWIDKNYSPPN
jgi:Kdo2-lipid IVA lauroyltransferase/acyltransferase